MGREILGDRESKNGWVSVSSIPSPRGRGLGRGQSASLLWGKHQSCRQPVEFHRLFTMPKDDFVCAGMRQFLSVFGQRSSETCLSRRKQFSHGFDLVLLEFACFVAADEDFEHGAAVAVDEVERAGVFAHKRAF